MIFSPSANCNRFTIGPAAGGPALLGNVVDLEPVDLTVVGEEENIIVGQGDEHVFEEVALAGVGGGDPPAAAVLGAIGAGRQPLDIAVLGDRDDHVFFPDQRFLVVIAQLLGVELAPAGVGVLVLEVAEVGADQVEDQRLVRQDALVAGDVGLEPSCTRSRALSASSPGEPLEPCMARMASACMRVRPRTPSPRGRRGSAAGGSRRRPPGPSGQRGPRRDWAELRIARMISSMYERAISRPSMMWAAGGRLAKLELGPATDDVDPVLDVEPEELLERQRLGPAVDQGQHDDAETSPGRPGEVLEELIQDDVRVLLSAS